MDQAKDRRRELAAVRRALVEGDSDFAGSLLDRLFARPVVDAEAFMLAGRLAAGRRDPARELAMMQAAVERDPRNGEYIALLGRCYVRSQQVEAALACAQDALECLGLNDFAYDAIASIFSQLGRHAEAVGVLQRAVANGSQNAAIHFNLGTNLKFAGDFTGARVAFEKSLQLAPQFHKAHAALTSLGGITPSSNNLPRLRQLIKLTDDPRAAIHLRHAAAKECEALALYDEAWSHLQTGKEKLQTILPYKPSETISALDELFNHIKHYDRSWYSGSADAGPLFIVGMPRSGTTVLDRIISNHRSVTSIGESLYFAQILKTQYGSLSRGLIDQRVIGALDDDRSRLTSIGERYLHHSRQTSRKSPRFVDKFHLNFMLSGHLLRALPNARILCVVRAPLDTIVSNYRQLFEFESSLYSYSLDLSYATEFYIRFRRLAALWAKLVPDRFKIIHYEELVARPEQQTSSALQFCGLEWQDGCSAIEQNTASVATASAVQVRSKINSASVGNWRKYASHLDEAHRRLRSAGLD